MPTVHTPPSLRVTCRCGARLQVPADDAGLPVTCEQCRRTLRLRHRGGASGSQYIHVVQRGPTWRTRGVAACTAARRFLVSSWRPRGTWRRQPLPHRWLAAACWGSLVAAVAVATVLRALGDRWGPATVLLFAGRWIWIVPVVFLAPVVALSRRALLVPLAVAAPIVLFGVMGLHTGWRRLLPADPTGAHLRVVTVNIAGRSDVSDQMPWLLEEWRPHVVAIQECGKALPRQLGLLARWHTHASAGLCLLSRYPIASAETMDRTSLARARKESDETIGGAGYVTRYVLSTPSGPIGFTNLHLETARKGLEGLLQDRSFDRLRDNTALREIESRRAREWVRAGPMPMIVAGDFNAPPESRNLRDHWSDFTDAFAYAGRGFGYTKRNGWIRHRIDQVRYSPGARAIAARVGRDVGSDHRPVIVDFRLTGWRGARDAATR